MSKLKAQEPTQEVNKVFIIFFRTVIMYFFVVITLRSMGKRQIGELEPSEFVVTIMISELASMPIQERSQPLLTSILAILMLVILEIIVSFTAYKSVKARKILYGKPSMLFENGKINQKEMEKQRFNMNDLIEVVRNNGASRLDEVEYVIVETNGNVSVLLKSDQQPLKPGDIGIKPPKTEISYMIIDNGTINFENLKGLGYNSDWLKKQLANENIKSPKDVFYFGADRQGNTFLVKNEED